MPLLSRKLLVPVAVIVVAWGGAHLLASRSTVAVEPATWPAVAPGAAPSPSPGLATGVPVTPTPAPSTGADIPILPGALQQLNGDTRDTALGMYALITQLESTLGGRLQELVQQLEPGR